MCIRLNRDNAIHQRSTEGSNETQFLFKSQKQALSGKTAIVTASTEGIGFAAARRLAEDGAKVWISSRKADNVERALAELRGEGLDVDGMVCHVGKADHRQTLIDAVIEQDKKLDILGTVESKF